MFAVAAVLAATYLYLVPFTNIVGEALFADYRCYPGTSVWGVCGRLTYNPDRGYYYFDPNGGDVAAGFFVFVLVQVTVGFALLATVLQLHSRRVGYIKTYNWFNFWCSCSEPDQDWVGTRRDQLVGCGNREGSFICGDDDTCCLYRSGPCMAYNSLWLFAFSIFVSTIIIGTWAGRAIAVRSVQQCIPYANTQIGLYGCVLNGSYVGGQECNNCAGIGFGILGVPLFVAELIVLLCFICCKRCVRAYRATEQAVVARRIREQQEADRVALKLADTNLEKEFGGVVAARHTLPVESMVPGEPCVICQIDVPANVKLPCLHYVCQSCCERMRMCPFCRTPYVLETPASDKPPERIQVEV